MKLQVEYQVLNGNDRYSKDKTIKSFYETSCILEEVAVDNLLANIEAINQDLRDDRDIDLVDEIEKLLRAKYYLHYQYFRNDPEEPNQEIVTRLLIGAVREQLAAIKKHLTIGVDQFNISESNQIERLGNDLKNPPRLVEIDKFNGIGKAYFEYNLMPLKENIPPLQLAKTNLLNYPTPVIAYYYRIAGKHISNPNEANTIMEDFKNNSGEDLLTKFRAYDTERSRFSIGCTRRHYNNRKKRYNQTLELCQAYADHEAEEKVKKEIVHFNNFTKVAHENCDNCEIGKIEFA